MLHYNEQTNRELSRGEKEVYTFEVLGSGENVFEERKPNSKFQST